MSTTLLITVSLLGVIAIASAISVSVYKKHVRFVRGNRPIISVLEEVLAPLGCTYAKRGTGGVWSGRFKQCPLRLDDLPNLVGNPNHSIGSSRGYLRLQLQYPEGKTLSVPIERFIKTPSKSNETSGNHLAVRTENLERFAFESGCVDRIQAILQMPVRSPLGITEQSIHINVDGSDLSPVQLTALLDNMADLAHLLQSG